MIRWRWRYSAGRSSDVPSQPDESDFPMRVTEAAATPLRRYAATPLRPYAATREIPAERALGRGDAPAPSRRGDACAWQRERPAVLRARRDAPSTRVARRRLAGTLAAPA